MKNIRNIKNKILFFTIIAVFYSIAFLLNIKCIFKTLTGYICPGCGMTRAFLSIIHLDFKSAFNYNPMIFMMPVFIIYIFKDGIVFKNKNLNFIILILCFIIFFLSYFIRLYFKTHNL